MMTSKQPFGKKKVVASSCFASIFCELEIFKAVLKTIFGVTFLTSTSLLKFADRFFFLFSQIGSLLQQMSMYVFIQNRLPKLPNRFQQSLPKIVSLVPFLRI